MRACKQKPTTISCVNRCRAPPVFTVPEPRLYHDSSHLPMTKATDAPGCVRRSGLARGWNATFRSNGPPLLISILSCEGLTQKTAAKYFHAAERQVAPAVPPPDLRMSFFDDWIAAADASGIRTGLSPFDTPRKRVGGVLYGGIAADAQGRRVDACTAYLEPVRHGACGKNLHVEQSAVATKIEVKGGRATGVTYLCEPPPPTPPPHDPPHVRPVT